MHCDNPRCGEDVSAQNPWTIVMPNKEMLHFCNEQCLDTYRFLRSRRVTAQYQLCVQHNCPWVLP